MGKTSIPSPLYKAVHHDTEEFFSILFWILVNRGYSYCIIDDVIISITISITELYGQLSGKRVVLCITKTVKHSSLVFGNNICSLTRYAVYDTGASIAN